MRDHGAPPKRCRYIFGPYGSEKGHSRGFPPESYLVASSRIWVAIGYSRPVGICRIFMTLPYGPRNCHLLSVGRSKNVSKLALSNPLPPDHGALVGEKQISFHFERAIKMHVNRPGPTLTALLAWSLLSASAAMADVIYERAVTPEEQKRYEVGSSGLTLPKEETMEQANERLSKEDFSKNKALVKVEIKPDPKTGRLIVWYTALQGSRESKALLEQWRKEAPEFSLGSQVRSLRCLGTSATMNDGTAVFFEDLPLVRHLGEAFRDDAGTPTELELYHAPGRDISNHEFLRVIIKRPNLRLEANAAGNFVTCHDSGDAQAGAQRIGWIAANGMVIYIGCARGALSDELLQLYVHRYPSILEKTIDLDKTHWGREEVDLWMGHLEKVVAGKDRQPDPLGGEDWFIYYAGRMVITCDVPPLKDMPNWDRDKSKDAASLAALCDWWKANRADSVWDERSQKLVVPVKKQREPPNFSTRPSPPGP
jgi:hypothetical protein